MNATPFLPLIDNAALLLAMALLFDLMIGYRRQETSRIWQIFLGLLLGIIGIALMLNPWVLRPGIIFDTRSVLLSIAGVFFGPLPTLIAMGMTAAFRIYQGGAAAPMGVSVILATGSLGILWRRARHTPLENLQPWELYLFGVIIHLVMLACAFVLPLATALQVVANIALPVMTIYPVGSLLLGLLMVNRLRRERIAADIRQNEVRMRSLVTILQHPVGTVQEFLDFALSEAIRLTGSEFGFLSAYSEETQQFIASSLSSSARSACNVTDPPTCYELRDTGLWGEVVRQRQAILVNDYPAAHPLKKGYPSGHVRLQNYLSVPIFNNEKIVAVVGVANKKSDYDETDLLQLTLLMDGVWKSTEQRQAEESLRRSEERYRAIIDNLPSSLLFIFDRDLKYVFSAGEGMTDLSLNHALLVGKTLDEILDAEDRQKILEYYPRILEGESLRFEMSLKGLEWSIQAAPLRDERGTVIQILALVTNITERKQAETKLLAVQAELQRLLQESDLSRQALLSLVEDQKRTEEEIQRLNVQLEQRVQERTLQLETTNKELEAFSYSVSHDLRAPLRALDGFTRILLLDYQAQLDEQGQHYLMRIQQAAQRMSQLIEDLLNLSHITRRELKRGRVDLSLLAQQVAAELETQDSGRQVQFEIAPHLMVEADENLMKIVLENLLNNAYKFTSQCPQARIQVGRLPDGPETVYFVRDNGTGFDMHYASKLFAPFQRLHTVQEFPGTGIGLVIVQRIIHRHGGRIWPEAAPGQGATFYFTLA